MQGHHHSCIPFHVLPVCKMPVVQETLWKLKQFPSCFKEAHHDAFRQQRPTITFDTAAQNKECEKWQVPSSKPIKKHRPPLIVSA